mgnify:FL=1
MHTFRHCPYCGEKLDFSLRHICPHCRQRYGILYSHWPVVLLLLGGCILIDWLGLVYTRWIWLGMLPYAAFWLFIVCPFLCPKFSKSSPQAPIPEGLGTPGAQALRFVPSYRAEADTVKRLRRGDVLLPTGEPRYTVPPVLVARVERRRKAVYFAYPDHSDRAETDVMLQNEYGTYRLTKIQRFLPQAQAVSQGDTK